MATLTASDEAAAHIVLPGGQGSSSEAATDAGGAGDGGGRGDAEDADEWVVLAAAGSPEAAAEADGGGVAHLRKMPMLFRSRGACSIFLGSCLEACEAVLVHVGSPLLGPLFALLPDLLGSVSGSEKPPAGLLQRLGEAHESAERAAVSAALDAKHYDYLGLERLPNASVSAFFFTEVDDKNRWKTNEWLFNNREKKRDEFKKLQKAFETPFSTAEKRAELDRQLQEAAPRFLQGGAEVRGREYDFRLIFD